MHTDNKVLLITGGTGSFGKAVLDRYLDSDIFNEIRIFSRDEKKQSDMMLSYANDKIKFYLGDVRDYASVEQVVNGVDYIFHAAALKQVPSCEFFPMEAVKTNVIGTENVLQAAIKNNVKKVVVLSTDKAVYPINAMGISKAMMEKVVVAKSRESKNTIISCTRYGNVLASRGSVIPLFIEQIKNKKSITVTNPDMTRFIMTLDQAVQLVIEAFNSANPGDIFVHKANAVNIGTLAEALKEMYASSSEIKIINTRHGEKIHESLLTVEEFNKAIDKETFFCIPTDSQDLDYDKYFNKGTKQQKSAIAYSSNTVQLMDKEQIQGLISREFEDYSLIESDD